MDFISFKTHNVYRLSYTTWDTYSGSPRSFKDTHELSRCIIQRDKLKKYYRVSIYTCGVCGVYLGDEKSLKLELDSHKYTGTPKTLYFTSGSKFPRAKATNAGIKRKLSPDKADAIVSNMPEIIPLCSRFYTDAAEYNTYRLFYSKSEDKYYILPKIKGDWIFRGSSSTTPTYVKSTYGVDMGSDWSEVYLQESVKWGLIPSDYEEIYSGKMIALDFDLLETLTLIDKGMQIIYDTDLDKIVSPNHEKLDEEQFKQVHAMLGSPDTSVVGMAMKLVANTDYSANQIETTMLLVNNWNNFRDNSVFGSVAFQQLLTALDLPTTKSAYVDKTTIFNRLYDKVDATEKERVRKLTIQYIEEDLKSIAKKMLDNYPNMAIVSDIKLT